jgi:hypothetical protein
MARMLCCVARASAPALAGTAVVPSMAAGLTACGGWLAHVIDLSGFRWQSLRRSGIVRG